MSPDTISSLWATARLDWGEIAERLKVTFSSASKTSIGNWTIDAHEEVSGHPSALISATFHLHYFPLSPRAFRSAASRRLRTSPAFGSSG